MLLKIKALLSSSSLMGADPVAVNSPLTMVIVVIQLVLLSVYSSRLDVKLTPLTILSAGIGRLFIPFIITHLLHVGCQSR